MKLLVSPDAVESIAGQRVAHIFKFGSTPETSIDMPISQLNSVLKNCQMAGGGSGGFPGFPARSVDYRYFECLQDEAPDKTLLVILPFDRNGSFQGVYVQLGGQLVRPSPPPPAFPPKGSKQ